MPSSCWWQAFQLLPDLTIETVAHWARYRAGLIKNNPLPFGSYQSKFCCVTDIMPSDKLVGDSQQRLSPSLSLSFFSPREVCDVAHKYGALTFVDEAHGLGMYGEHGRGLSEEVDCCDDLDIISCTLGKGKILLLTLSGFRQGSVVHSYEAVF